MSWYLPAAQSRHVGRPPLAAKLPGRQSRHTLASLLPGTGLALPAAHCTHAVWLDAPVCGLYVPAGHWVYAMLALAAPSEAQKPPTGHGLQLAAPVEAL